MDKDIGIGIITGIFISIGFLIYNLSKKAIHKSKNKEFYKSKKEYNSISDKLDRLNELYEQGILTENEYYEKSTKLKAEQLQTELKLTPEYKKLKSLLDDGILTKEEFENKIKKIKIASKTKKPSFKIKNIVGLKFKIISCNDNTMETNYSDTFLKFNENSKLILCTNKKQTEGDFQIDDDNNTLKIKLYKNSPKFDFLYREWTIVYNEDGITLHKRYFNRSIKVELIKQ